MRVVMDLNFGIGWKRRQTLMAVSADYFRASGVLKYEAEYPFSKYNVPPTSYTYSQDEYTRFLEGLANHHYTGYSLTNLVSR